MSDNEDGNPGSSPSSVRATPPSFPSREDCWTEEATHTLIHSWGTQFLHLNRGNLRQTHWQQVADQVNSLHALSRKQHRTDIQCKNRIDTLKKRFKIEKSQSQSLQGNPSSLSTWPFFNSLDRLIGDTFIKTDPARRMLVALPPHPSAVPVGPRSKRPVSEEALSRRNFSAMAAAAARAAEEDHDDDDDDQEEDMDMSGARRVCRKELRGDGYKRLAEAIGRFAEVYQRVEESKQRQVVELEKQRMQFTKDLEIQRMKLFMESQVHLERIKRVKRNTSNGE